MIIKNKQYSTGSEVSIERKLSTSVGFFSNENLILPLFVQRFSTGLDRNFRYATKYLDI